jgi:hypothetical protein
MMRALVVYESMFGTTRDIALAVADGIGRHMPAEAIEVGEAPARLPDDVTLLVVGGPTHGHGMSTPSSRTDSARRAGDRLVTRGSGIREWLDGLRPDRNRVVALFDTRIRGPELLWGSAAKAAAKQVRAAGFKRVEPPCSFLVDGPTGPMFDRLRPGELDRARSWGASLARE